jgi:hypothetical protein
MLFVAAIDERKRGLNTAEEEREVEADKEFLHCSRILLSGSSKERGAEVVVLLFASFTTGRGLTGGGWRGAMARGGLSLSLTTK